MNIDFKFDYCTNEAFTSGDCWRLASALNLKYGYPLVAFFFDNEGLDNGYWCHFAVQTEDGRVLDITGIHDTSEVEKEWGPADSGPQVDAMIDKAYEDMEPLYPEYDPDETAEWVHEKAVQALALVAA